MDLPISTLQAVSSENSDDVGMRDVGEEGCNGYNNGRRKGEKKGRRGVKWVDWSIEMEL